MSYLNGKATLGQLARMRDRLVYARHAVKLHSERYPKDGHMAGAVDAIAAVLQEIVAGEPADAMGRPWAGGGRQT